MQEDVMKVWDKNWTYTDKESGQIYNVKFDISVKLYEGIEKNDPFIIPEKLAPYNTDNYIEVSSSLSEADRSEVNGGDEGSWRGVGREVKDKNGNVIRQRSLAEDDPAPHETGHLLGLTDRYDDETGTHKGWEGNIMAESRTGKVEQKNIDAIVNQFMPDYKDYIKNREKIINMNDNNLKAKQQFGVPYIHNEVPSETFETKIDNDEMEK